VIGVFWGFYRTPEPQRNWAAIEERLAKTTRHFQLLDRWLEDRAFMLGEALTLADIPIGTHLYRYFNLEIERPAVPNVEAWYRRLQQRPSYPAHLMGPVDDLFGRLDPPIRHGSRGGRQRLRRALRSPWPAPAPRAAAPARPRSSRRRAPAAAA